MNEREEAEIRMDERASIVRLIRASFHGNATADEIVKAIVYERLPDCICRTSSCGHPASQHIGPNGDCLICRTGCWS